MTREQLLTARDQAIAAIMVSVPESSRADASDRFLWHNLGVMCQVHAALCRQLEQQTSVELDEGERREISLMAESLDRIYAEVHCFDAAAKGVMESLKTIAARGGAS